MSGRRRDLLGYEFTPTPRPAIRAVPDRLDPWDYVILAAIYDRDVPRTLHVRFTLEQLAGWVGWPLTPNALSKRLRRIRDDGWIRYEQPKKPPYRYEVTLVPEPPPRSEVGPRSKPASQAETARSGDGAGPRSEASGPSSEDDANVAAVPSGGVAANGAGPSSPERPENGSSLSEDGTYRARTHRREGQQELFPQKAPGYGDEP